MTENPTADKGLNMSSNGHPACESGELASVSKDSLHHDDVRSDAIAAYGQAAGKAAAKEARDAAARKTAALSILAKIRDVIDHGAALVEIDTSLCPAVLGVVRQIIDAAQPSEPPAVRTWQ